MKSSYVWDKIWSKDKYSEEKLRSIKAKEKYDMLSSIFYQNNYDIILDLGCGAGFISNEVAKHNNKSKIVAIDKSYVAINKAKRMFENSKISFLEGDMCQIPLEDNSVNLVLCIGSIEHVKDTDKVFNEISRVIRRDGKLIIMSSNKKSFMYIDRKIKEFLGIWKYGYQKNWKGNELVEEIQKYGIRKEYSGVREGIGDFGYITIMDKLVHAFNKDWGRYIFYIGRRE